MGLLSQYFGEVEPWRRYNGWHKILTLETYIEGQKSSLRLCQLTTQHIFTNIMIAPNKDQAVVS